MGYNDIDHNKTIAERMIAMNYYKKNKMVQLPFISLIKQNVRKG
jgi:hypothetical protein